MMTNTNDLRSQLKSTPYTDLPSWSESLSLAGTDYVDDLTDEMVIKIKARLDALLNGEAPISRASFYDDDAVGIGLDEFRKNIIPPQRKPGD